MDYSPTAAHVVLVATSAAMLAAEAASVATQPSLAWSKLGWQNLQFSSRMNFTISRTGQNSQLAAQ